MTTRIRTADPQDADEILSIYRPYVEHTAISFEQVVPSSVEIAERIRSITQNYAWLLYESEEQLLGYAYATGFRARPAYRWTVETTIYLAKQARGSAIATQLYQALFDNLAHRGFYTAVAVVTEPNPASEKFHRKMGFEKIGIFRAVGYKLNQWHDVGWWQKQLQDYSIAPTQGRKS